MLASMKIKLLAALLVCALGAMHSAQAYTLYDSFYVASPNDPSVTGLIVSFPLNVTDQRVQQSGASTSQFDVSAAADALATSMSLNLSAALRMEIPDVSCGGSFCAPPQGQSFTAVGIYFHLDETTGYTLSGSVFAPSPADLIPGVLGTSNVTLYSFIGDVGTLQGDLVALRAFDHHGTESDSPLAFFAAGVLEAGDYVLRGHAAMSNQAVPANSDLATSIFGMSASSVQLTFSPVPLPGALWLLVSGIGGIAAFRRSPNLA